MKRGLTFVLVNLAAVTILIILLSMRSTVAWSRAGRQPWPEGLGTLEQIPTQYPKRETSTDARRLDELIRPLEDGDLYPERIAARQFVGTEIECEDAVIGAPPPELARFMEEHAAQLDALRDHLLSSREIAWEVDLARKFEAPGPNSLGIENAAALLVGRALIRAQKGEAVAWDELRAASILATSLQARPELLGQLDALDIVRSINAVAWKMPLPAPPWLASFHAIDHRRLIMRGVQYETWLVWRYAPGETVARFVAGPYLYAGAANLAEQERLRAMEIAQITTCGFDRSAFADRTQFPWWNIVGHMFKWTTPNLWSDVFRYHAEREATANALRARTGLPVSTNSQCSDGSWRYADAWLSFTVNIKAFSGEMPLTFAVTADRPEPPALAQ